MEWTEGLRGVWWSETERDGARKRVKESGRWGGRVGSRWWGPGEHFIFLIDNNGFINERSFHTLRTVHHWLEFCGRARKPKTEREMERKKHSCERGKNCVKSSEWNSAYLSQSYCPTLNSGFSTLSPSETKIPCSSCGHSCIPTYFLTGQIVCHTALLHSCTQARLWQRNKWLRCSLWTTETFRRAGHEPFPSHIHTFRISHMVKVELTKGEVWCLPGTQTYKNISGITDLYFYNWVKINSKIPELKCFWNGFILWQNYFTAITWFAECKEKFLTSSLNMCKAVVCTYFMDAG